MKRNINNISQQPLFWVGLLVKIFLICFIPSQILVHSFGPFVDFFAKDFQSPYHQFNKIIPESFPYPALMLYILTLGVKVMGFLSTPVVIKVLLLLADFVVLFTLVSMKPNNTKSLVVLYWLSPALIFISYIHGQLDVLPIALLFLSLIFLFRNKVNISVVFLALSVAAKTSMALVVPFYFVFLYLTYHRSKPKILLQGLLFVTVFVVVNLGFLGDKDFLNEVFLNSTQLSLFDLKIDFHNSGSFLVPIACYLALLFMQTIMVVRTRTLFILFCGFAFGVIIMCLPPTPGWYYWLIPFWIYLYVTESRRVKILLFLLQLIMIGYFSVLPGSDLAILAQHWLGLGNPPDILGPIAGITGLSAATLTSIAFTFLQTLLLLNIFVLFKKGIEAHKEHAFLSRPMILGVGGNSGSGKSTFTNLIRSLFAKDIVTDLKGDDSHRWERGDNAWTRYTHLNPKANKLHEEFEFLSRLKLGKSVERRHYNHSTGKFVEPKERTYGGNVVIYDGLHPYFLKKIRDLFDIKVFLAPEDNLAVHWKVVRDQKERGYTVDEILKNIEKRREDFESFIKPQMKYADIIISYQLETPLENIGSIQETPHLKLEISFTTGIDLGKFVHELDHLQVNFEHCYQDEETQKLILHDAQLYTSKFWNLTLSDYDIREWGIDPEGLKDGFDGFVQVFFIFYFMELLNERLQYA